MAVRKKTGGRKKGTPNKTTTAAKEAIEFAAQSVGGPQRLAEWIKEEPENERAFWTQIYPKLLPLQVNGSGAEGEIVHQIVVEYVRPSSSDT